jgi:hypothetical protein
MTKLNRALKAARAIPSGRKTKAKCKAVHKWYEAVLDMLKADK